MAKAEELQAQLDVLKTNRFKRVPSRPGEFHPEPLTEPDVSLSTHPAPIIQPHGTSPNRQWAKRPRARRATDCSHLLARLACRCNRLYFWVAQRTR